MPAIERQPGLFDYDALTPTTREIVQRRTGEIHTLMRRTAADIVDVGLKLIEVKEMLRHGNFGVWLKTEFGWSADTAQRFMRVGDAFKNRNLRDLDIAPSALYALASGDTSEEVREELLQEAEAGRPITHKAVKERNSAHLEQFQPLPPAQRPIITVDAEQREAPADSYPPHDPETGELLAEAASPPDYDSPELQALIRPDENHVITPKNAYEQEQERRGWDEARRLESVLDRCIQSLTALGTHTREQLQEIADSPAGGELLTAHRLARVQQLCSAFLRLSDYDSRTIDARTVDA